MAADPLTVEVGGEERPAWADQSLVGEVTEDGLKHGAFRMVAAMPEERDCPCATALANARFEV